jgi:DNA polymerase III sliding clamp (beta) subunit (PCNA family)
LPSYNAKLIVDKYLLEKAIKKVSLFSKDLSYMVKFIPEEEQLIVSSGETDLGEGVTKIPAIYE